ncbi:ABC transporter permease [bacterium]|nr:ABC transporter permease [bacterium]
MFRNYLKFALRNLVRQKAYALISIVSLALGLSGLIVVALFVQDELSYDRFHLKGDRLFRIVQNNVTAQQPNTFVLVPGLISRIVKENIPEVETVTRLTRGLDILISYKDKQFYETNYLYADATVFDVFTIPLVRGDARTALANPNSIVITESIAHKYFGTMDPIGQVLTEEDGGQYTVTAVTRDMQPNSHFHFDFMASLVTITTEYLDNYLYYWTYVVLKPGADPEQVASKLDHFTRDYLEPVQAKQVSTSWWAYSILTGEYKLALQSLYDIHLHSGLNEDLESNSNATYVFIMGSMVVVLFLISCLNFINLTNARSSVRAREIGLRKVFGSSRRQLIPQFLVEAILLSLVAFLLALSLTELLLPYFNEIIQKELSLDYLGNYQLISSLLGLTLLIGLIGGIYPAFVLSSFRPLTVLQGKQRTDLANYIVRKGLLVLQLVFSFTILVSMFYINNQIHYLRTKNLGFDKEHILIIRRCYATREAKLKFKQTLLEHPRVLSATYMNHMFGQGISPVLLESADPDPDKLVTVGFLSADADFFETFQLKLREGETFQDDCTSFGYDIPVVANEVAIKVLGFEQPLGQFIMGDKNSSKYAYYLSGIVQDFHYESLYHEIQPLIIVPEHEKGLYYLAVRIVPEQLDETLGFLNEAWQAFAPQYPFQHYFLDEEFDQFYQYDQRIALLFIICALCAFVIVCLGLLGQTAYSVHQRTKEIGIRKVLGARPLNMVRILIGETIVLLCLANLIAWPIAYILIEKWLEQFAYRTSLGLAPFLYSALVTLGIVLITVLFQVCNLVRTRPVDSLKYE